MKKAISTLLVVAILGIMMLFPRSVRAQSEQVLGVHILNVHELDSATQFLDQLSTSDSPRYVTVPFVLDDLRKPVEWQEFFYQAKAQRVIPIIRLATRVENGAWQQPTRKEIVDMINFLAKVDWQTEQRYLIVFNEVNHAKEWGNELDPTGYADTLEFAGNWAHATHGAFRVLPAAMDLAAPNGRSTAEAFSFLTRMYEHNPEVFDVIDYWNSHSYPNPGFSSSPQRTTKDSLRGFQHELAWIHQQTGRDFKVFITETGWAVNRSTLPWLESYYTYAFQHVWSDPRIVAVTPFVLKGDPGPFSHFGFIDKNDQPTVLYTALQRALQNLQLGS